MRVIAGKYKRRLLKTLAGTDVTRPTADRVRESLFNMLAPEIDGAIVWDLFAGSGALGIEALSRGAGHVTFVEQSAAACKVIGENLKTLGIHPDTYTLVVGNVETFLQNRTSGAANSAPQVSLVLADPPYHSAWYDEALGALASSGRCARDCLVVLEMKSDRILIPPDLALWSLVDERRYGIAQLQFWRLADTGSSSDDNRA
ncbi:MAG: 16S rRNA (guanine(966)-N(2))-methyltransferase RsmD [Proteobacteria bacterium]|nr:16S rRNA (guanine(966)-N(2))-methyltransferase RsmD [Pseudomonadota bacterium]